MNVNAPPRLPRLPFVGYEPPDTQPTAVQRVDQQLELDKDREIYSVTNPLGAVTGGGAVPPEVFVYKTFAPWRALDVYVQLNAIGGLASNGLLSVFVYAIVKGVRSLVASGRQFIPGGGADAPVLPGLWICGVRGVAQRFEVTTMVTQLGNAPVLSGQLSISIAASNEAVDLPDEIGTEQAGACYLAGPSASGSSVDLGVGLAQAQVGSRLELVQFRATNGVDEPRYLQLFDTTLNTVAPGTQPLAEWPMGALAGQGLSDVRFKYRCTNRVQLLVSSTLGTLTKATDGGISAILR